MVEGRDAHQLIDALLLRNGNLLEVAQVGAHRALRHLRGAQLRLQQQQPVLRLVPHALDAAHLALHAVANVGAAPRRGELAAQVGILGLELGACAGKGRLRFGARRLRIDVLLQR